MKMLIRDFIPSYSEFGMDGTDILISVHEKTIPFIEQWIASSFADKISEEWKIPQFIGLSKERWGFGEVLLPVEEERTGWISWKCPLPVILGSSGDEIGGYAVSITLEMLCDALSFAGTQIETDSLQPQLLSIDPISMESGPLGMRAVTLSATVSSYLAQWFSKQEDDSDLSQVLRSMREAYAHLFGRETVEYSDHPDFRAKIIHPKWISLDCPGDACGLDPAEGARNESLERGYRLTPHNVDGPIQMLTHFAGLAALDQFARSEMSK